MLPHQKRFCKASLSMILTISKFSRAALKELNAASLHIIVAALTLLLPWALSFRALRLLTRLKLGSSPYDPHAYAHMHQQGFIADRNVLLRQIRLHRLVDLADFYKSYVTTSGWVSRYWNRSGDMLPSPTEHPAVLFVTFHYGQGFWALNHFKQHGLNMAALYRPPPKAFGELFNYYFFWIRLRRIQSMTGTRPIRVGATNSELRLLAHRLLKERAPIGVMPDIPVSSHESALQATLLNKSIYFPRALLRLAVKNRIPVVLYTSVLNLRTGARDVNIECIYSPDSESALAQGMASSLERALLNDPTAWHLWPWSREIITERPDHY